MKRLRDIEPTSKLLAQAQALLDAEPPLPESRERMLKVRRALEQLRIGRELAQALHGGGSSGSSPVISAVKRRKSFRAWCSRVYTVASGICSSSAISSPV